MVIAGHEAHNEFLNPHFTTDETEVPLVDYLLAGAIFNIKLETSYEDWKEFTLKTLRNMDKLCSKGFSFNMLTKCAWFKRKIVKRNPFVRKKIKYLFFIFLKREWISVDKLNLAVYWFDVIMRK